MYLIDANVFVEILDERANVTTACNLLSKVEKREIEAITTGFAIHSVELYFLRHGKNKELSNFLHYLATLDNLYVYHTLLTDELKIIQLIGKTGLDFDDAIQYYAAKLFDAEAIISFDKDFDGLDIPRKEPTDII